MRRNPNDVSLKIEVYGMIHTEVRLQLICTGKRLLSYVIDNFMIQIKCHLPLKRRGHIAEDISHVNTTVPLPDIVIVLLDSLLHSPFHLSIVHILFDTVHFLLVRDTAGIHVG